MPKGYSIFREGWMVDLDDYFTAYLGILDIQENTRFSATTLLQFQW